MIFVAGAVSVRDNHILTSIAVNITRPSAEIVSGGVLEEKTMYGKKVMGINRSTFVIDGEGKLLHHFQGVNVEGHIRSLLDLIRA